MAAPKLAVLVLDRDGRCRHANDAALRLAGHSLAGLRSRPLADILAPAPPLGEAAGAAVLLAADGGRIPVDFAVAPIDGAEAGVSGYLVEIAPRDGAADRALRESEERYRALVQATAAVEWRAGPDGALLEAPAWAAYTGQPVEAHRGWGWVEMVHPDDRAATVAAWEEAHRRGEPLTLEYRVRRAASGAWRWVAESGVPLRNPDGSIREWIGTVTDIDERRRAEAALRESETRLEIAAAAADLGIWDWDVTTDEMVYSPRARAICGFPPDVPITFAMVRDVTHPEDLPRTHGMALRALDPKLREKAPYEYRLVRPDGTVRWVLAHGAAVFAPDGSRALRYVGTIQDITERKELDEALRGSEARLRIAIEAGRMAIWDFDFATDTIRGSPELNRLLGFPDGATPGRDQIRAGYAPGQLERMSAALEAALAAGERRFEVEFRYRRADGPLRWLMLRAEIAFGDGGTPLAATGVIVDVTERRDGEEALRANEERLRVALAAGQMGTWQYHVPSGRQHWDERQYGLLGIDPSEPASRELFLSVVHPDDRARVAFDNADMPPPGSLLESTFRIVRPSDGALRWLNARSLARHDADGRPVEMIGVNWDVTAEKEAEEALRVSEERHRLAIEANALGAWDFDLVTGARRWSAQYSRIFGLPEDAEPDPELIRPLVSPEEFERGRQALREAGDPAGSGLIDLEFPFRRADGGDTRWALIRGRVFFDENRRRPVRAVGILLDTTERKLAEVRQRLLLNELNHRVKNTLAIVQAIVAQTFRVTPDPAAAFDRVQARLLALAGTHDILNRTSWLGASLADILDSELRPYRTHENRIVLEGPPVDLDPRTALALGLILHELAANATKYGALSAPEGRLEVIWRLAEPGPGGRVLSLSWQESDGPPVAEPTRSGFGSRLIERSVRDELNGRVVLDYAATGFCCLVEFPLPEPGPPAPA